MLTSLRRELRLLRDAPPGRRFIRRYNRMKARKPPPIVRGLRMAASLLVAAAGIAMLVMPGPGLLVVVLGLAMLGGEFRQVSELMDTTEVRLRRLVGAALRLWSRASLPARGAVVAALLLAVAGAGYGVVTILLG